MSKPHRLILAAACTFSVLAAGCGPAPEEPVSAAPGGNSLRVTKEEFLERANAICLRMIRASEAGTATLEPDADADIARVIELQGRMINELRTLEPPAGDQARVQAVLLHLRRLQAAMRALRTTEGEEVLVAVAAIGVEMDAVARAANRYGLFRRCGAYDENPAIQQLMRKQRQAPAPFLAPRGKPLKAGTAPPPGVELRQLVAALLPPGRAVLRSQDCSGDDPASPACVTIELAPADRPITARRAEIADLATREGWTQPEPTAGRWPADLLVLHREGYDATVRLVRGDCTPELRGGDGAAPQAGATRCLDTVMVIGFR